MLYPVKEMMKRKTAALDNSDTAVMMIKSGIDLDFFRSSPKGKLRWPNTVFARAFADAIERAHKDCKERSFHLFNIRTICAIFSLLLNAVY